MVECCENAIQEIEHLNWNQFDPILDERGLFQFKLDCVKKSQFFDNKTYLKLRYAFNFPTTFSRILESKCPLQKNYFGENYDFFKAEETKLVEKAQSYVQQIKQKINFSEQIPSLFFLATIHLSFSSSSNENNIEKNHLMSVLNCGGYVSKIDFDFDSCVEKSIHFALQYYIKTSVLPWVCVIDTLSDNTMKVNLYTLIPLQDIEMWEQVVKKEIQEFIWEYFSLDYAENSYGHEHHIKQDERVKNQFQLYTIMLSEYLIFKFYLLYDGTILCKPQSLSHLWNNPITFVKSIFSPSTTPINCIMRIGKCWVSLILPSNSSSKGYLTYLENNWKNQFS